ncbi:MAG: ribonuclease P protein component [Candidatus Zambryskibacteria bacterium RIFCSPHIGHO2_01_FULL_44_22b]|uniref:Ribonuclease P protein component n=1 Tax=Candidatus Zambryskibacteria bacterium RIFCSPHIGHO2_01_FULL_44_22b TaxID=1802737 RepID=A0A1G2T0Z2_9BACT|nr:MAG: ribonuclease P protein component [Candidatus Zambryskibacteria bacterium RIFCSPHIGHO2_01_FULL_44_22b]
MYFYLRFSPSDQVKLVISVSKKISKKAVVRNTVKRRVRAVMRSLVKNLKPGIYMIVAKPGADKIKGKELEDEIFRLIRSIRN